MIYLTNQYYTGITKKELTNEEIQEQTASLVLFAKCGKMDIYFCITLVLNDGERRGVRDRNYSTYIFDYMFTLTGLRACILILCFPSNTKETN